MPEAVEPIYEFVFTVFANLDAPVKSVSNPQEVIVPITGGSFVGPAISGIVCEGGKDVQHSHPTGEVSIRATYELKSSDGELINIVNTGVISSPRPRKNDEGDEKLDRYFRAAARVTSQSERYAWMNAHLFMTSGKVIRSNAVAIDFYVVR